MDEPTSCTSNTGATIVKANYLSVFSVGDNEYRRLRRANEIKSPSIPIQLTETSVELRDGSPQFPISLPALEKSNAQSVGSLLIQDAAGQIKSWAIAAFNGRKRLVALDGSLQLVPDYSSDMFTGAMCPGTCEDVDGIIGYKDIVITCPGQPDIPAVQLFKLPGCCYGDVPEEEV